MLITFPENSNFLVLTRGTIVGTLSFKHISLNLWKWVKNLTASVINQLSITANMETLPEEILLIIFKFVHINDLPSVSQTCRLFRRLVLPLPELLYHVDGSMSDCNTDFSEFSATKLSIHNIISPGINHPKFLVDIRFYRNVTDIVIFDAHHISTLSPFRHLRNLNRIFLLKCNNIRSGVGLENVANITVVDCPKFLSVSTLGSTTNLVIQHHNNNVVIDVSNLGRVYSLAMVGCSMIGIPCLVNVHTLILDDSIVSDVSMLYNVKHLSLRNCRPIDSVHNLILLETLDISGTNIIRVDVNPNCKITRNLSDQDQSRMLSEICSICDVCYDLLTLKIN